MNALLRPPPPALAARPAPVLRRCACGGSAGPEGECEGCRKKRLGLQRSAASAGPSLAPPIVHDVLAAPGRLLDAGIRTALEPRFGHSFAHVRVHDDARAAASARAVEAHAYTVGRDVVFAAGRYRPESGEGRRLIAHELAHVVQQDGAGPPARGALPVGPADDAHEREARDAAREADAARASASTAVLRRDVDPLAGVATPTAQERQDIRQLLDPRRTTAAATGTALPAVADPAQFRTDMRAAMRAFIRDEALPPARARASSPVSLALTELRPLADVVQREARARFGTFLSAARRTDAERQRHASLQLRDAVHLVSETASEAESVACQWVSDRMKQPRAGGPVMEAHGVLASESAAKQTCTASCPAAGATPAPRPAGADAGGRDQALFESVRDEILADHCADVRTIVQNHPGFERPGAVFIQERVRPDAARDNPSGSATPDAAVVAERMRRRGRWEAAGTLAHEMMHDVAHECFRATVEGLENANIAVEGFAELFARELHNDLRARAGDAALRAEIEGVSATADATLAPERRGGMYQPLVDGAEHIRDVILGGSDAQLRAAFFMGRMEYLGLRDYNAGERDCRASLVSPNAVGLTAAFLSPNAGYFRLDYGRIVLGRGGRWQLTLGGNLNLLTAGERVEEGVTTPGGERLGIGGNAGVRWMGDHLVVQVGVGLGPSISLTAPPAGSAADTIRLDLTPEFRVAGRIGSFQVGGGVLGLVPLASGDQADRLVRWGPFIGVSGEW